jgi:hypothetical protein
VVGSRLSYSSSFRSFFPFGFITSTVVGGGRMEAEAVFLVSFFGFFGSRRR